MKTTPFDYNSAQPTQLQLIIISESHLSSLSNGDVRNITTIPNQQNTLILEYCPFRVRGWKVTATGKQQNLPEIWWFA